MPRKHRFRLTMPKKSLVQRNRNAGAPSDAEWERMEVIAAFQVDDEQKFKKGDFAILLPDMADPDNPPRLHEFWVGILRDIRARHIHGENDVWVRVQWFYSPDDVKSLIKSFDASTCGRYERVLSDDFTIVSLTCFSDVISVKEYVESNIDQEDIYACERDQDTGFFYRYDLEHRARTINPKHIGTCLCSIPYNPDKDIMHLCPHPSCRRWYHRTCLVIRGSIESKVTKREREDSLLSSSPDSDEPFPVAAYQHPVPMPSPKKGRGPGTGRGKGKSIVHVSPLATLPEDLLETARLPIVKGAKVGGLVGNVRGVVAARRIVYAALEGREPVPKGWREKVIDGCKAIREEAAYGWEDEAPPLKCPQCQGAI
ncbi:hypothetical protein OE88DRAFT_1724729 [Heliocybe sulcata]|uniref:BAH domain-containing protein n=1 Tax=Heliocybe sulcata TaxID=5364 RepID=A0A5C3N5Q4_9AGAM|nr:hypothetical protein OE88DRAFT_1724729 [Heliocybe sulcata]